MKNQPCFLARILMKIESVCGVYYNATCFSLLSSSQSSNCTCDWSMTMNQIKLLIFEQFCHLLIRFQGFKGYWFARRKIDLMKNNIHVFKIHRHTFGPSMMDICGAVYFISHFLKRNNIVRQKAFCKASQRSHN